MALTWLLLIQEIDHVVHDQSRKELLCNHVLSPPHPFGERGFQRPGFRGRVQSSPLLEAVLGTLPFERNR